jgi:hypothetical protein
MYGNLNMNEKMKTKDSMSRADRELTEPICEAGERSGAF